MTTPLRIAVGALAGLALTATVGSLSGIAVLAGVVVYATTTIVLE